MKKGITVVTISIIVVIIITLLGTITVGSYNSIQNGKKLTFALEISSIQEEVDRYEGTSADDYPITGTEYVVDLSNISTGNIDQFDDETKDGNNVKLYEIDLSLLGIDDTQFGNKQTDKDIYLLSLDTGRVYYLEGLTYRDKTYYTLTQDLINIKEKKEKVKDDEISNEQKPVITTKAFVVKTNESNSEREIYLTDINVEGEEIKTVKYDKTLIEEQDAKEYFKNNGFTLNSDRIKVKEGEYITIYAETKSGKYSVRLEGIPTIPKNFYYVGGSIPTGVVISDSSKDANKGTDVDGDVVSDGLEGNQFVWVPVDNFSEFVRRDGYENGAIQTLVSSRAVTEPYSTLSLENDLTGEWAEYTAMKDSVKKYSGFYIGRYEAGSVTKRSEISNGTTVVLCKKNAYPYNYVTWGSSMTTVTGETTDNKGYAQGKGAVQLARESYNSEKYYSIASTLIYSIQWDAAINFMKNVENPRVSGKKYIENSFSMGWYADNVADGNPNCIVGVDVDQNASNKVKNIYDMAGNIYEWTMEAHDNSIRRVIRGGYYACDGNVYPASFRNSIPTNYTYYRCGFRVALYIK